MEPARPKVSIGLPVYNAEKYLEEALRSIIAQTYTNFELIISDNASTDATERICQEYVKLDPRIHYFRNEKNLGAAPNFNRVFELSTGQYFKWAAYDDILAPEFISRCVDVLDQYQDVILSYSKVKIIDENGMFEVDYDPGPDTNFLSPLKRFQNLILCPEYAIQQMGLVRADILNKSILHRSFPSSDEVLLAELGLIGRFFEIPERLFFFRRHSGQVAQILDQRSRMQFFDSSTQGKIVLPKWQYLFACVQVIHHVQLNFYECIGCYLTMIRWMMIPAHFKALGKDILLATSQYLRRIVSSASEKLSSGKGSDPRQ